MEVGKLDDYGFLNYYEIINESFYFNISFFQIPYSCRIDKRYLTKEHYSIDIEGPNILFNSFEVWLYEYWAEDLFELYKKLMKND